MMFVLHLKRQKVPNRERSSIQARYDLGSIPILPYNYAVISTYSIRCFTILATSIGAHSATQSIQHKRSVIRICTTRTSGDRGPCPHWRRSHYDIAFVTPPRFVLMGKGAASTRLESDVVELKRTGQDTVQTLRNLLLALRPYSDEFRTQHVFIRTPLLLRHIKYGFHRTSHGNFLFDLR